ncbi:MAG: oxidoreductase [Caldivirga sp. JCHS_4]|jgi:Dehydrogenases with different specificities (related to short-chain alcohol dehydrogenases)|nr:MAG: oxidoreductase [Caldivirga sp. JCHS_4]
MPTGKLSGKVAIVTGGARGIGAAIAYKLGLEGARVIIADVNEEAGRWREGWLRDKGIDAVFVRADVSVEADVKNMVNEAIKRFGNLNILINNAGIGFGGKSIFEQTLDEWNRVISTNLTGVWLCSKYAGQEMAKRGGGVIVNIASTRAFQSEPNTEPYSASKGGIVALTHSLAVSLARYRIRVVSVAPGWIDTSEWQYPPRKSSLNPLDHAQHPAGRVGDPMDVANLVAFLVSDEASWITGVNSTIDGGMTIKMIYMDPDVIGGSIGTLVQDPEVGELIMRVLLSGRDKVQELKRVLKTLTQQ